MHLVTEFIQGGELYYRIVQNGVFPEKKAAKIFKQVVLAVQHMVGKCLFIFASSKCDFYFNNLIPSII